MSNSAFKHLGIYVLRLLYMKFIIDKKIKNKKNFKKSIAKNKKV